MGGPKNGLQHMSSNHQFCFGHNFLTSMVSLEFQRRWGLHFSIFANHFTNLVEIILHQEKCHEISTFFDYQHKILVILTFYLFIHWYANKMPIYFQKNISGFQSNCCYPMFYSIFNIVLKKSKIAKKKRKNKNIFLMYLCCLWCLFQRI